MIEELFDFIQSSPTAFHTVASVETRLKEHGFQKLEENCTWTLEKGCKYYVNRNGSSVIAFSIGKNMERPVFRVIASHGDSPCFKIKENSEISVRDKYIQLNTEGYGGMICYSWMDRPLSVAGRIQVKENGKIVTRLVNIDRDLVMIPSVAIHMNKDANKGMEFNKQVDMLPLLGMKDAEGEKPDIKSIVANELGIKAEEILGQDLYVYNRAGGTVWGADKEFISSPRLDDLQCACASLTGFLDSANDDMIKVYACFDNEEVGSETRQGAGSSFLEDTIKRISDRLGFQAEEFYMGIADSFMLSEDNGHAVHPNHPEKTDSTNCVYMNGGIVVKSHAGQRYSSDSYGTALCRDICNNEEIPIQFFSNRSDEPGGTTLGNIAACRIPIRCVDIGLAQLAMHSAYETAGAKDTEYMRRFSKAFYEYEGI